MDEAPDVADDGAEFVVKVCGRVVDDDSTGMSSPGSFHPVVEGSRLLEGGVARRDLDRARLVGRPTRDRGRTARLAKLRVHAVSL